MTTTNIISIDLTVMKASELKTLARDNKVSNWWTKNKSQLLEDLTAIQNQAKVEATKEKKATSKKVRKAPKTEEELKNTVTIKDLAFEFGMKPTKARRILRSSFGLASTSDKTRWEWTIGSEELDRVRAILHDKASIKEAK